MVKSIVEAVFQHAENTPDKLCLVDEKGTVTYAQYKEKICKMATVFQNYGIGKEDKVVLEASQTIAFLAAELALQLIGAIFVPLERNCAWNKMQHVAKLSEAKMIVPQKENEDYDNIKVISLGELEEKAAEAEAYAYTSLPNSDDISELLFSTGTTGKEKGIIITHDNNIGLAENVVYGVDMQDDNVEMIPSPLNHSHGLRRYYGNMFKGTTVVLFTSVMNVKLFFDMVDKYGVNSMNLVPSALSVILKLSKDKFGEYKDTLRYIQCGSAALSDADKEKVCSLLPNTHLYNFYGSTESGCICICDVNTEVEKPKCIGRPTHNVKIVIVDEERNEIQSSAENTGLLASYGRMNTIGYWKDEEETAKVVANGFIYSNDEAYIDEDGEVILLGRKGDVINTGGNKVSPEEVEEAALQHPSVADSGCIGVPDAIKGSVPKLFVQIKKGHEFDVISIREKLTELLEPYKVPVEIVQLDEIPRTFNGKILRRVLREKNV